MPGRCAETECGGGQEDKGAEPGLIGEGVYKVIFEMVATAKQREQYLERYSVIMTEIKERSIAVWELANRQTFLNPTFARELCFLQLRLICECIALSCLIAHEDISAVQTSRFQKSFQADLLMNMLQNLHSDFYPVPIKMEITPGHVHLGDNDSDCLSKEQLTRLVHFCGGKLHKGSLQNYSFKPTENQIAEDFKKILKWTEQIVRLLEQHKISAGERA